MNRIDDYEHNIHHMNDIVSYIKELLNLIGLKIDADGMNAWIIIKV